MVTHSTIRIGTGMSIPTLPAVVAHLTSLIESPDSGTADVGQLLGGDPALTAKVLVLVNSAAYGIARPCMDPQQACTLLGLRRVHAVVVQAALIREYERLEAQGHDLGALWRHAPLVGECAAQFAHALRGPCSPRIDEARLAGLLHDVGQIILLDNLGEAYADLRAESLVTGRPIEHFEALELGYTHAELGARAIDAWGFGTPVRDAVAHHHGPDLESDDPLCVVVRVAERVVEHLERDRFARAIEASKDVALGALGMDHNRAAEAVEHVHALLHGRNRTVRTNQPPLPSTRPANVAQLRAP